METNESDKTYISPRHSRHTQGELGVEGRGEEPWEPWWKKNEIGWEGDQCWNTVCLKSTINNCSNFVNHGTLKILNKK